MISRPFPLGFFSYVLTVQPLIVKLVSSETLGRVAKQPEHWPLLYKLQWRRSTLLQVHMFVASPAGVVFLDIDHPAYFLNLSQRMPSSAWRGRNFGFVSDEEDKIPRVVLWPSQPLATVPARGSRNVDRPPLAIWASESAMARGGKETLHNNVSPVRLPSHNNSLLVLAHSHQPPFFAPRRSDEEKKHLPLYGLKYMHTWLLAEGDYPFRIIAQSPPFCLPSPQNARRCETIQYVTTMLLSDDGSELILGYVRHVRRYCMILCEMTMVVFGV